MAGRARHSARTGNIVDTLNREHPLHFARAFAGRVSGNSTQTAGVGIVEMAQQDLVKIDGPDTPAQRFECHQIACESFPDEAEAALPFDLTAQVNPAEGQRLGITRRAKATIAAATETIIRGWGLLRQGFMWALVIVILQPASRPHSLAGRMGRWRQRGFGFEHAMPLFMRTVVFGMAATGKLDFDAQG